MPDRGELCLRLTGAASRSTVSREVLNANRQSAMPTTARTSVVMVSERWRFSDRVICGDTTTDSAMIAPAAPSVRALASLARSWGSWVMAEARDPKGMLTRL